MPINKTKDKRLKTNTSKVTKPKAITAQMPKAPETVMKKKPAEKVAKLAGLTIKVFDISGKSAGTTTLPKEFFGQKPNSNLLRQAMHVYFVNQSGHFAHAKTRAEIRGGGRKPWRQKGTGRARAGSTRSPLWVGGAKALGPRKRNVKLDLPKKMKKRALISALSQKALDGQIKIISNLEKITPKTKIINNLLAKTDTQKPALLVISEKSENLKLASRNIPQITLDVVSNINAFEIVRSRELLISKDALVKFI